MCKCLFNAHFNYIIKIGGWNRPSLTNLVIINLLQRLLQDKNNLSCLCRKGCPNTRILNFDKTLEKKLSVVLFAVTLYICRGFSKCCTCGQIDEVLLISFDHFVKTGPEV